jgi:DNA helicase HerA-like ATPase
VGEALVSFLDEKGRPHIVERAFIVPPQGQIGPITPQQRQALISRSLVAGVYEKQIDRESAYEVIKARTEQAAAQAQAATEAKAQAKEEAKQGESGGLVKDILLGTGRRQGMVEAMAKSAVRTMGSQLGRQILRGVLGGILGGRK